MRTFGARRYEFSLKLFDYRIIDDDYKRNLWKIQADSRITDDLKEYLAVEVECVHNYKKSNLWSCNAAIELKVTNKNGRTMDKSFEHCFDSKSKRMDFGKLLIIRDSVSRDQHLRNDEFQVVVNIQIKSVSGIGRIMFTNFSIPKNIASEIVLYVGKRKLYVDRCPLMCFSSVFRELLSDEKETKFDIENVKFEDFVDFLRILYGEEKKITYYNVQSLQEIAVSFDVQFLIADCEYFLKSVGKRFLEIQKYEQKSKKQPQFQQMQRMKPIINCFLQLQLMQCFFMELQGNDPRKFELAPQFIEWLIRQQHERDFNQKIIELMRDLEMEKGKPDGKDKMFQYYLLLQLLFGNMVKCRIIEKSKEVKEKIIIRNLLRYLREQWGICEELARVQADDQNGKIDARGLTEEAKRILKRMGGSNLKLLTIIPLIPEISHPIKFECFHKVIMFFQEGLLQEEGRNIQTINENILLQLGLNMLSLMQISFMI